ncbi:MAG: hypothetical protein ABFC94_18640 [Syntrophomonas sp.]
MKKGETRWYLPVGIFSALLSIVVIDIGSTLKLWIAKPYINEGSKDKDDQS